MPILDRGWKIVRNLRDHPWSVVAAAYILLYGALLVATDGLPYATDNNESYSSVVHAHNLANFDFTRSFGLTDESYADTEAGHPYIHSHQGNFPRLYAFVLYMLGAQSVQSQIWLTTFTIGLAALGLAYRFASRYGGARFGVIATLVLLSDYLLFAQWQVNTYRVWHAFFFFSSLECVHLAAAPWRKRTWLVIVANFAGLCYWEYVYAAFVGLLSVAYALLIHRHERTTLLRLLSAAAAGGALAAGVLLLQLTAYMGWENVLLDIRYTLLARNSASDPAFAAEINAFYDRHNILFWQNYVDASTLRSWDAAWTGVLTFQWRYAGPCFVALAIALVSAVWTSLPTRYGRVGSARGGTRPRTVREGTGAVLRWAMLTAAIYPLGIRAEALSGVTVLSSPFADHPWLAGLIALALSYVWTGQPWGFRRLAWSRLIIAALFAQGLTVVLADLARRFGGSPALESTGPITGTLLGTCALLTALLLALSIQVLGPVQVLGRPTTVGIRRFGWFAFATFLAFAAVYRVFTGYVYSGYLHRQAPLLVFALDLILALAALIAWVALIRLSHRLRPRTPSFSRAATWVRSGGPLAAASLFLAAAVFAWGGLQAALVRQVPPFGQRHLLRLGEAPYAGSSFAVSSYAAPVAVETGTWAYFESSLFSGLLTLGPGGWDVPRDHQYLWFADRATNPAYAYPEHALLLGSGLAEPGVRLQSAERSGLIQRSSAPFQPFLQHRITDSDRIGYSIVKLDWDFPPFLELNLDRLQSVVTTFTPAEKLALRTQAQSLRRRWYLRIMPENGEASGTAVLVSAQIDGRPVFSASDLADAGWASLGGPGPGGWRRTAAAQPLSAVVEGDDLTFTVRAEAGGERLHVAVNERTETIDLRNPNQGERTFHFTSRQAYGSSTFIPVFAPGLYVETEVGANGGTVRYRFRHQRSEPEAATVVRVYWEEAPGLPWRQLDEVHHLGPSGLPVRLAAFRAANPDTVEEHRRSQAAGDQRRFVHWLAEHLAAHPSESARKGVVQALMSTAATVSPGDGAVVRPFIRPLVDRGRLQVSVTPGTLTKEGPEYFGLPFPAAAPVEPGVVGLPRPEIAPGADLPFGRLKLRLRFPRNRWPQSEPLLATGVREAGDFIYVIYVDPEHIRIGFDHWFRGGPLTPPLRINPDQIHELEISIGSLYPSTEDIVYAGLTAEAVARIKQRVIVTLNGETVIDAPGVAYESSSDDVMIGRNGIGGTSSGPVFTGEIIEATRGWPESP